MDNKPPTQKGKKQSGSDNKKNHEKQQPMTRDEFYRAIKKASRPTPSQHS